MHRSAPAVSTAALKSAQTLVIAIVLDKTMGHGQAQVIPSLEPRADAAAGVITSGLAAGEPSSVVIA